MISDSNATSARRPRRYRLIFKLGLLLFSFLVCTAIADRLLGRIFRPNPPHHRPNHQAARESLEYKYEFRTNSRGLRSVEIPLKKPTGEYRVVVAGDSFTEGVGVSANDAFCSLLQNELTSEDRDTSFINCGLAGTGPTEYGRLMLCVGMEYQPDVVLLVVYANDLTNTSPGSELNLERRGRGQYRLRSASLLWQPGSTLRRLASGVWPWTYATMQRWRSSNAARRNRALDFEDQVRLKAKQLGISDERIESWKASLPATILQACNERRFNPLVATNGLFDPDEFVRQLDVQGTAAEDSFRSMRHVLSQIVAYCRQDGVPIGVVYAPSFVQVDASLLELPRQTGMRLSSDWLTATAEVENRLQQWAHEVSVPFYSLTETFRDHCRKTPGGFHFRFDTHWNAAGHRLAALSIAAWMRDKAGPTLKNPVRLRAASSLGKAIAIVQGKSRNTTGKHSSPRTSRAESTVGLATRR